MGVSELVPRYHSHDGTICSAEALTVKPAVQLNRWTAHNGWQIS